MLSSPWWKWRGSHARALGCEAKARGGGVARSTLVSACLILAALGALGAPAAAAATAEPRPPAKAEEQADPYAHLEYRLIGPAQGGRVSRVAGIPGDPMTYWAATAAGGVWKSENGGLEWKPVFDDQPTHSTGSIAVAPSDPNVVYVGAGEANIRGNVAKGNGIYRTTDGGRTWEHVWKANGQIGTMIVHPRNPDVAYAAVLGSPFGPNPERGVYRTRDGGKTWERVLFVDSDTGASDVCLDPSNPRILFAGTWQARRRPWGMTSGGPGSGLWASRDGGDTWKPLKGEAEGLPEGMWGKVGVQVAPSDPRRVYALIEAEEGGLFRSDDGGETWERINASRGLRQRAWYYTTLTVDPTNAEVVWFPQVPMLKSIDGGRTVRTTEGGGWDHHDVWIDPADPRRIIAGSDAGVSLSRDGGATWVRPPIPITQLYHVATDGRRPYRVLASAQDWGTVSGPSNSLHEGGILLSDWHPVGGGEAGHVAADPNDPDVVWAGEYLGFVSRWDGRTGQAAHVGAYLDNGSGHGAGDLAYRFQWTAPIAISPHDPKTVYHAANVLFRTRDGGQSWEPISPDLTRDDPEKQRWSGGPITGDNTGVEFYGTIFAVAESPLEPGLIWAGTDDGRIHVTRDAGGSWQEVTPAGMPAWATVRVVEPSRFDAGTAYAVADSHRLDDDRPYLWKTSDGGRTWRSLASGLPQDAYLHVVREDPAKRGMLYAGSERGVWFSRDDGARWERFDVNLPTAAVHDLVVHGNDLVVGTMGRSIWIFDDLTPVREMSPAIRAAPIHLFPPPPAVRWRYASAPNGTDDGAGANPPRGALFTYWLGDEPEGELTVEVLDAAGEVIRGLSSTPEPLPIDQSHPDWWPGTEEPKGLPTERGLNRGVWDLRSDGAELIPGAVIDIGDPRRGYLVPPGDYTLRLTVGGERREQALRVEIDPRSAARPEDVAAQHAFALGVRDKMTEIARMVGRMRAIRAQIEARNAALGEAPEAQALVGRGQAVLERLAAIEGALHNPQAAVSYDILAGREGGAKLYSRLAWLWSGLEDHDGPPTQGMRDADARFAAELAAQRRGLDELVAGELARLDQLAREAGSAYVVVPR